MTRGEDGSEEEETSPVEFLAYDEPSDCPYLPGLVARMPLRMQLRRLSHAEFDERLAAGDRRTGPMLYKPDCPACQACEPIRIVAADYRPNATQRRLLRRGSELITMQVQPAVIDDQRVDLFNLHRELRSLTAGESHLDAEGYESFLTLTCCDTREIAYYLDETLVGIAIIDVGASAISAVYTFYDPRVKEVSLGTYSVLQEIALCTTLGKKWLYLGYYVAQSEHMRYKGNYLPHERLIGGEWREFLK